MVLCDGVMQWGKAVMLCDGVKQWCYAMVLSDGVMRWCPHFTIELEGISENYITLKSLELTHSQNVYIQQTER
jgi:hypothetical protein